MQAVVCSDFQEAEVAEVPRPDPADDEVLVEVERVQLSVTECELYRGIATSPSYDRVRERMVNGDGLLFGHEFCGTVVEAGPAVEAFDVGDRVYAPGKIPCHDCAYCRAGREKLCANKATIGLDRPGALAEYVALPTEPLSHLLEDVSAAAGAAMQPVAAAMIGVHDAPIESGDVVAVVGTGAMGFSTGQFARYAGAGEVIAIDVDTQKLDLAAERDMRPVDAREADPVAAVEDATGGIGADVVFECVGGDQDDATGGDGPLAQSFAMVRRGGSVVQVGYICGEVTLTPRAVKAESVDWLNPPRWLPELGPNAEMGTLAAEMVADGRVSVEEFVTHEFRGLESFERAIEVTANKPDHDALGPAQIVLTG
ncbi:zinc-binding dehydrogenase [Halobacteriales archaeon QS_8_69_26]|nr:MAG: zinc-binding dehydrogenase [Halobacteriales archaeon QS_8_69_26]